VAQAISKVRANCGGDCETAAFLLESELGANVVTKVPFAHRSMLHEWIIVEGKVVDATAAQYVKPGLWTAEALESAGLTQAVETGVFTIEQHVVFIKRIVELIDAAL
jgi:hypothetical protein